MPPGWGGRAVIPLMIVLAMPIKRVCWQILILSRPFLVKVSRTYDMELVDRSYKVLMD